MASNPRPLIAGNWKMNGLRTSLAELDAVVADAGKAANVDLLICPPATLVAAAAAKTSGTRVSVGGQDCHANASGAHTGDVSAEMLKDAGASAVIVGHSERRADHGESNAIVCAKTQAAWRAGLLVILCVGETQAERHAGNAQDVVGRQLAGSVPDGASAANLVVAYEPVWAIGTGRTPTSAEIEEIHGFIRSNLIQSMRKIGSQTRILYGGSVKPSNAAEILKLKDVDGALVGGASLKASDFLAIAGACP